MPGSCYHDFKHCVWLTLDLDESTHPWEGFIQNVPPHVTLRAYLSTAAEARARARGVRLPAGGAAVRLSGNLTQSHTDGFYALEHPVVLDVAMEELPAWWPKNAHISFGYRYNTPFSDEDIEAARARLARGPRRARLQSIRCCLCRGHFVQWCNQRVPDSA